MDLSRLVLRLSGFSFCLHTYEVMPMKEIRIKNNIVFAFIIPVLEFVMIIAKIYLFSRNKLVSALAAKED